MRIEITDDALNPGLVNLNPNGMDPLSTARVLSQALSLLLNQLGQSPIVDPFTGRPAGPGNGDDID